MTILSARAIRDLYRALARICDDPKQAEQYRRMAKIWDGRMSYE